MVFSNICRAWALPSLVERVKVVRPAQEGIIRLQVVRAFAHEVPLLLQGELQIQRRHDLLHDLILQGKDVFEGTVVALGPQMSSGGGVNQLRHNPHLIARFLYTAFQHVAHAQFFPDLLYVHCLALVGERRVAGDNEETGNAGEISGEDFGDAVAEIVLLGIVAHVVERQDDDGGLIGQRKGLGARG